MRIPASVLSIGLLALALPGYGGVPGRPHLEPGQRVRIEVRNEEPSRRTGIVIALTADSLALRPDSDAATGAHDSRVVLSLAVIKHVDISLGTHRQTVAGLIYGGQIGLIAMLLGTLAGEWLAGDAKSINVSVGCAAAGGTIGTFVSKEDWRPLPLRSVRVSLGPDPVGGLRLEASVALRR